MTATSCAFLGSRGEPMRFLQSQPTAALRTWMFHLALSATGADATGLTPAVNISKAGAAFGAATGTVTEVSGGWYKYVFAAADLNTLGQLAVNVTGTGADPINVCHFIDGVDLTDSVRGGMTALPAAAAGSTTGLPLKSELDAVDASLGAITVAALPTTRRSHDLGTLTTGARTSKVMSLASAIDATITLSGNFFGGSAQVKVSADGISFSNYGSALTSAGAVAITEAHYGVEVVLTGGDSGGTTAIDAELSIHSNEP